MKPPFKSANLNERFTGMQYVLHQSTDKVAQAQLLLNMQSDPSDYRELLAALEDASHPIWKHPSPTTAPKKPVISESNEDNKPKSLWSRLFK